MINSAATTGDVWNRSSGSPSDYDIPRDLDSIHQICDLYLEELRQIVTIPSSFALTAVLGYVSFLSNLAYSENFVDADVKGRTEGYKFKCFLKEYLWPNQEKDAEIDALYHVLRCGLAHTMSFYGDNPTIKSFVARQKGKMKTTLLSCRQKLLSDDDFLREFHATFTKVIIDNLPDAIRMSPNEYHFCPTSLLSEVRRATEKFFKAAYEDTELQQQILDYVRIQPPIVPYNDKDGSTAR